MGTKDEALLSDEIEKLAHVRKVVGGETAERDREMEEHLRSLQNNMRGLRARPMTIERAPTSAELAKQVLGMDKKKAPMDASNAVRQEARKALHVYMSRTGFGLRTVAEFTGYA